MISTALLITFCRCLGGAIGLSIAKNIFANNLKEQLSYLSGINIDAKRKTRSAGVLSSVPEELLSSVEEAYLFAIYCSHVLISNCSLGSCIFLLTWY
jgi:hypothetical protein